MKLVQIGRYPPPYGGITIHVQRLTEFFIQNNIDCKVLDLFEHSGSAGAHPLFVETLTETGWQRYLNLFQLIRRYEVDIAHIHVSDMGRLVWGAPALLRLLHCRRRVMTIHHGAFVENYKHKSKLERALICQTLRQLDVLVLPTEALRRQVIAELGNNIRRSEVIPTFIGFSALEHSASFALYDDFVQGLKSQDPNPQAVILISGYGFEHYGFGLVYQALQLLAAQGIRLAVIVSFYGSGNQEYMNEVVSDFRHHSPTLVVQDLAPSDFRCILAKSDIYVRPTTIHSCGVTVYEALALGTLCVASDVCDRPQGTILHRTGDATSLAEMICSALGQLHNHKLPTESPVGGEHEILSLYESLL